MAKNYFKSYIWLLETLQSRGPLTLAEIKKLWMRSSVNDEGKELATRTFANHVASIADIFGIDILCDRRDNTYYIENDEDLDGHGIRTWMLDALSLNEIMDLFDESTPRATRFEHLNAIVSHQTEQRHTWLEEKTANDLRESHVE